MSNLTNMFDSRFIPQMIESPVDSIIRKIEGDTETYICNRLMELNIDNDILMNQTQEITRLNQVIAEYERLEGQGLLLRLPCKVGDTVYCIHKNEIIEDTVFDYDIWSLKNGISLRISLENYRDYIVGIFGKTVFLTYQEAELELANIQQSHAEAIMDERNGR